MKLVRFGSLLLLPLLLDACQSKGGTTSGPDTAQTGKPVPVDTSTEKATGGNDTSSPPAADTAVAATDTAGSAKPDSEAPAPDAVAPEAAQAATLDPETQKHLAALQAGCEASEQGMMLQNCKNKEDETFLTYAKESKSTSVLETVLDAALVKGKTDRAALTVAVLVLKAHLPYGDLAWFKAQATPGAADRAVALVSSLPPEFAWGIGEVLAGTALLGGRLDALVEALEKLPPGQQVRGAVYPLLMKYGGMAVTPALERLMKSTSAQDRFEAAHNVGIAIYENPLDPTKRYMSDEDRTKACDWAKGFLADPDTDVVRGANDAMTRCKGTYIDAALTEFEKRVTDEANATWLPTSLYHLCWSEGFIGAPMNGSPEQCTKAFALAEKALSSKSLEGDSLRNGLWALTHLSKNANLLDKGRAVVKKFLKHQDKSIADSAKRFLEEDLKK